MSLRVLRIILPRLKGWPLFETMSLEDLAFAAASLIAVAAFLRGGENFTSPNQSRAVLVRGAITLRLVFRVAFRRELW